MMAVLVEAEAVAEAEARYIPLPAEEAMAVAEEVFKKKRENKQTGCLYLRHPVCYICE